MTSIHAANSIASATVPDTLWFTRCPVLTATGFAYNWAG